jgi:formylglycine-generating enzyme required for sulfatase activity/energy-coupling factor transporter ATP-binding protein EcfA2
MPGDNNEQTQKLRQAIAALEAQQRELSLDFTTQIAELQQRLREATGVSQSGSGAVATAGGVAAGEGGAAVGGNVTGPLIVAGDGANSVIGEQPVRMTGVQRGSALGRYLSHIIGRNRYLQLQGIRSGGRLVNIELEHIYITLKATHIRTLEAEEAWLAEERQVAPGEWQKHQHEPRTETVTIKVDEALAEHQRLVVLGDPGSGKTTLLRYLALCYARDRAEHLTLVRDRLGLPESGYLPILLPLRNLGAYLKANYPADDGTEGHGRLLEFLRAYLQGERIDVPADLFDVDLNDGRAMVLLDGMDEVGDFALRRRVARLVEAFAAAYPNCRVVVTSRIVGYAGPARLGEDFTTTTIRDFTLADVEEFLTHWHRLVAIGQMGPGEAALHFAARQTQHLMEAIRSNPRVRELAINPLMLTVIALVHRDRVKLPERRAELYAEAVEVLLGKWDEARGVEEIRILEDRPFDITDRRLLLQSIALKMHEAVKKAVEVEDLLRQLQAAFARITPDARASVRAAEHFLTVIKERTGLLVEAGPGSYRFSHLTFQEYLAAVEVAEGENYVEYTLARAADPFWREVILLEAGYLSTKNRDKTTRLIKAIADFPKEPELFHNLVLAFECIRDVGPTRVEGDLATALSQRLQGELEKPIPEVSTGLMGVLGKLRGAAERRKVIIKHRIAAATALSRIETGRCGASSPYWSLPYGEPEWVTIRAGEFWMGSDPEDSDPEDKTAFEEEKPAHRLFLPEFQIARTPVTHAQYHLYIEATGAEPPPPWEDGEPPKDKLNYPVFEVSWYDARRYCEWLSKMTGKRICLPSEAEWEKAARGDQDKRIYPWGDTFDVFKCNSVELGLEDTTPVGIFTGGVSLYGCLDMVGNVLEWTRSLWGTDWQEPKFKYRYDLKDGREDLEAPDNVLRVLRGGAFWNFSGSCVAPSAAGTIRTARTGSSGFGWCCSHDSVLWFSGLCHSDAGGVQRG